MTPNTAPELIARGNRCFNENKVSEAATWFKKATRADPGSFVAHAYLGNIMQQLTHYEDAVEAYLRALEIKQDAPLVTLDLGECFEKMNRLELAERYYQLASRLRPDDAQNFIALGNALQKQGNNSSAINYYKKALELDPTLAHAHHNIGLCLYDDQNLHATEEAFRRSVAMDPENALGACFLGIILEQQGKNEDAREFINSAKAGSRFCNCLVDSVHYAFEQNRCARFFSNTADVLRYAISQADSNGLFLEFGVYYGSSLSVIAESTHNVAHGFDSFEGLPESWFVGDEKGPLATEPSGAYTTKGFIPHAPDNTELHAGWFENSLPEFVSTHNESVSFMNIDCDIYSSTKTIFDLLKNKIRHGTIIVFDEYFCYPEWRDHEYRAFQELISDAEYTYEYIAFSYFTGQAAVRIVRDQANSGARLSHV
jgi:tetratricopeptide (TPR) repeat protein